MENETRKPAQTSEEMAQAQLDKLKEPKRKPYELKIEGSLVPGRAPKSLGGGKTKGRG